MDTENQTAAAPAPEVKIIAYYTFTDYLGLNVADKIINLEAGDPPPPSSTTYKWPDLRDPKNKIYWDGIGWFEGRDVAQVDIDTLKTEAQVVAARAFSAKIEKISGDYPGTESRMWVKMAADARAFATSGSTPFLDAMAKAKGVPVSDVVSSIMGMADAYDTAYGTALGEYQVARAEIDGRTKITQFSITSPHFLWVREGDENAS